VKIQTLTKQIIINRPIQNVEWPVQNVLAFTTTRQHPQKQQSSLKNSHYTVFDQFNLGEHVGDNLEEVRKNRDLLVEYLPPNSKIQWFEQVHGNKVVTIDSYSVIPLVADAAITQQKNIALAIMTADCLPILLSASDGSEVAAIHAGWKPLANNIITHTVNSMRTSNENIIAWLGPCIGKLAFEVGEEVKLAFLNESEKFISAFSSISNSSTSQQKKSETKYLADLAMIAKIQLSSLGIKDIHHLDNCTYSKQQQYFSYRRDNITGRMATIICRT
jgi:YfiH family protein